MHFQADRESVLQHKMFVPLATLLGRIITKGNLRLIDASQRIHEFGDGRGEPVTARLKDKWLGWQLAVNPSLYLGEAYMDGRFVMERGSIYDFLELVLSNAQYSKKSGWIHGETFMRRLAKPLQQLNNLTSSRKNVAHHYDINGTIYDLFLDRDRQYSCAYFDRDHMTLEEAQLSKKRHLAAKLLLEDGLSILDIGSGWGGLGLFLAVQADVNVTGVTLSTEQLKISNDRVRKKGLQRSVRFEFRDYREINQRFDRIVSVGMFEHVGVTQYNQFFTKLSALLRDDGIAVIHSIGRFDQPSVTNPFISKYVFPGGYIPALSEVFPAIEKSGLIVTDVEILRLHYAQTLRRWRERFLESCKRDGGGLDPKFRRMWEFYLAGSEAAFRYQNLMVFQIQLAKLQTVVPLTRDYQYHAEAQMRRTHATRTVPPRLAGE